MNNWGWILGAVFMLGLIVGIALLRAIEYLADRVPWE